MDAHAHHIVPAKTYAAVLGALLALTVITVLVSGVHFGSPIINVIVAMGIASVKASLVALYFMHLRYDKPMNGIIFLAGLFALGVFLIVCFVDTGARIPVQPTPSALAAPAPAAPAAAPTR